VTMYVLYVLMCVSLWMCVFFFVDALKESEDRGDGGVGGSGGGVGDSRRDMRVAYVFASCHIGAMTHVV
jgi:hypothetical protein